MRKVRSGLNDCRFGEVVGGINLWRVSPVCSDVDPADFLEENTMKFFRTLACGAGLLLAVGGSAGAVDRDAVLKELTDPSAEGANRRLGPDYASLHAGGEGEKFPEVWMPPSKQEQGGRRYQIGGPWRKEAGDFSSTQGQVLYIPDEPAKLPGVDRVMILEWSNYVFSERPEAPWWGGFRPEPSSKKWLEASGGKLGVPVGIARGSGNWANCGVIVFSSGLVSSAGTATARGMDPILQLPAGKVPTSISVTNKSEFALITVCDTQTHKGQVAVIALESNGAKQNFVHEWQSAYPGAPNVAVFSGMKLLGFIDLPEVEFPTGISAVGNRAFDRMNGRDGNAGLLREYDLAKQADRDVFSKGSNSGYSSSAGFAVVTGKYENKAAFIDLQPLFQRVRQMYFSNEENFAKSRDMGAAPEKWPFAFEADPTFKPVVVKTIEVPTPTAVICSMTGGKKARALIASVDGKVGVYTVGGLATDEPAAAEDIAKVGEVQIGRNPTCLAYQKFSQDKVIAVCRGDREIAWIKYGEKGAEVTKRLRDARLKDPVYTEMSDTHGIETSLITVVDFNGKQVLNYRFSQLVWATQGGQKFGMGPDGKDEFECGGVLEFPGKPIAVSASNVN